MTALADRDVLLIWSAVWVVDDVVLVTFSNVFLGINLIKDKVSMIVICKTIKMVEPSYSLTIIKKLSLVSSESVKAKLWLAQKLAVVTGKSGLLIDMNQREERKQSKLLGGGKRNMIKQMASFLRFSLGKTYLYSGEYIFDFDWEYHSQSKSNIYSPDPLMKAGKLGPFVSKKVCWFWLKYRAFKILDKTTIIIKNHVFLESLNGSINSFS